jgi:hypothetical protein
LKSLSFNLLQGGSPELGGWFDSADRRIFSSQVTGRLRF